VVLEYGRVRTQKMILSAGLLAMSAMSLLAQEQSNWKAGVASVVVTPREPIRLAGFASRDKSSQGVAADLRVKALALQDASGKPFVIVTADLIALRRNLSDIIAERCRAKYGLTRDRLLLNASHTHSGPELSLGGGPGGPGRAPEQQKVVEAYTKELLDRTVDVVGRAIDNLAPATLQFDQGLAGFAVNRRRSRPNTRQFPGPVDQDVPVLAVRAPDGELRAILFGYACHPTTNAGYRITADYPGYAQTTLEKLYPGAIALFVQGCGADSNPLPRYHSEDPVLVERSLELSTLYGRILAYAVDLVLRGKMKPVAGPLTTAFEYVDIPFEPLPSRAELEERSKSSEVNRSALAKRLLRAFDAGTPLPSRYPYAIQVCRFTSGLKIIALTGEVVVDYSLRLKAAYGWEDTWVAGYSNDLPTYIPSKRVLLEGGYETHGGAGGAFSTAVEEVIVEKVDQMVRRAAMPARP
jgi:neutral ceramidase